MSDIGSALATAVAPPALSMLRAFGKTKYDKIIATYTNVFDDFLKSSLHKCEVVKTLLNTEAPVPLSSIYVDTNFDTSNSQISDENLIRKFILENGAFAITGLAGSGKSIFMKHATSTLIRTMANHQRVTLFVEVRDLDFSTGPLSLEDRIFSYCHAPDNRTTIDQFKIGLREGLFITLLDGIDETPTEHLNPLLTDISKFIDSYRQCTLVASVRPGTRLPNITHFKTFRVSKMTLGQVLQVISKAPFNEDRKKLLADSLSGGLYNTHQSFLSNPLLVTIVLITFDDASQIPKNLTGFYSSAFDALFGRHDWSKGVFVRQHKSGLEKAEFEQVFTYLCYQSYFHSSYIFDRDRIAELVTSAIKQASAKCSTQDFIDDCILAVCLLQIDEPKIIFVHRSFQEYFTAKFLSRYSGPKRAAMLRWISHRSFTDNTFLMTAQLDREGVARSWAMEELKNLIDSWGSLINSGQHAKILHKCGIASLSFELRSGSMMGQHVKFEDGYASFCALLALGEPYPETVAPISLDGAIYIDSSFAKLPESSKRALRSNTSGETVTLRSSEIDDIEGLSTLAIAQAILENARTVYSRLNDYLVEQDKFADFTDVALPSEVGRDR